jgi:hypothetical protein
VFLFSSIAGNSNICANELLRGSDSMPSSVGAIKSDGWH